MLMLRAAGILLVALGVLWSLQGAGILDWPAGSFMLGDRGWVPRGIGTAVVGAALIALVEWRRRR